MALDASAKDGRSSWYACILLTICFTFAHMDRSIITLLVGPIEHEFHLSDGAMGLLIGGAFAISYAALAVPLAGLADKYSRVKIIAIGMAVWCGATICCGSAHSVPTLFAARIGVAAGEAVLVPAAASLLADHFAPARRTAAMSVFGMGPYFGGGLALLGGGALFAVMKAHPITLFAGEPVTPWRAVLVLLGAVGLVLVPLVALLPEPARLNDAGEAADRAISPRDALRRVRPKAWALTATMLGFAAIALANFAFHAWSPTLFTRLFGWTVSQTGLRLGLFPILLGPPAALLGAALAAFLARRGHTDHKLLVGIISACGCAAAAIAFTVPVLAIALIGMGALQALLSFNYGVTHAALVELLPNRLRAQGVAVYTVITAVFSMTIGPLAVGILTDHFFNDPGSIGISIRVIVPTAFVAAASILALGLRPYRRAVA